MAILKMWSKAMAEFRFLTIWLLEAPIEKVWEAIADNQQTPTWWKAVSQIEQIQPGDELGVGSVWRMVWKTPLSYTIAFRSEMTRVEPPHRLELNATGEVEGTGKWELSTVEAGTLVHYYWIVRTTKPWMNFLALLIRPLLEWNHNAVMQQGAEGLSQFLGARLLRSEAAKVPDSPETPSKQPVA
jgi:uncharacterized protein YndB with AHSA1/START domain